MVLKLVVDGMVFHVFELGSHHCIWYPATSSGLWRRQESVTGTRNVLRIDGKMPSWQLRTPGSGTVTVTMPTPEKEPAGILTVQSPFRITPPRSPFTVPETTFAVEERSPEFSAVGWVERA